MVAPKPCIHALRCGGAGATTASGRCSTAPTASPKSRHAAPSRPPQRNRSRRTAALDERLTCPPRLAGTVSRRGAQGAVRRLRLHGAAARAQEAEVSPSCRTRADARDESEREVPRTTDQWSCGVGVAGRLGSEQGSEMRSYWQLCPGIPGIVFPEAGTDRFHARQRGHVTPDWTRVIKHKEDTRALTARAHGPQGPVF